MGALATYTDRFPLPAHVFCALLMYGYKTGAVCSGQQHGARAGCNLHQERRHERRARPTTFMLHQHVASRPAHSDHTVAAPIPLVQLPGGNTMVLVRATMAQKGTAFDLNGLLTYQSCKTGCLSRNRTSVAWLHGMVSSPGGPGTVLMRLTRARPRKPCTCTSARVTRRCRGARASSPLGVTSPMQPPSASVRSMVKPTCAHVVVSSAFLGGEHDPQYLPPQLLRCHSALCTPAHTGA